MVKDFSDYREEFPIIREYVFFNNAAISAPPMRVVSAVGNLLHQFSHDGLTFYPQWMGQVDGTRSLFARLINAEPEEICFTGNTSDGISAVAGGIDWKPGSRVLLVYPDFPSNVYPWLNLRRFGVEVDYVRRTNGRFSARDVESALRPETRLLAVSSTDFSSGFYCDLEELGALCGRKGILFCVDAIQSLGAVPMDVKRFGIHFLAAGGHKWLLSQMGIGALFISREVNGMVHPVRVGWRSVEDEENFQDLNFRLKADARRFETGTLNIPGITALGASLELLLEIGIERIHARILEINDALMAELTRRNFAIISPMEREHRAGILSFLPPDAAGLFRYFLDNGVLVSQRGEAIRLSPHFYNNGDDIGSFFRIFDRYLKDR
ncbi:MAG: aminotransferase class V-fold PLP-dependent enzyme [Syntrophobacter sp.]